MTTDKMNMKINFSKIRNYILDNIRPDIILILSFALVILCGSLLLMLPFSNKKPLSYIDALFMATTATCVTGLITEIPQDQFTFFGQAVLLLLIQVGGLGFMTFISVFLLFSRTKLDFKERILLKDSLNKEGFNGISSYILAIVRFTFLVEGIGFILYYWQFSKYFKPFKAIWASLFISISAFCNAGIDPIGATSLNSFSYNSPIIFITAFLIIAGGLGFGVWFELYNKIINKKKDQRNLWCRLSLHCKIVLIMTLVLTLAGMILIFLSEYNGVLKDLNLAQKLLQSFFNSVTLRTAGFTGFDYANINTTTKFLMIPFMLIGGSPGGTAGGFKSTTFLLLLMALYAQFRQEKYLHIFGREIDENDYNKSTTLVLIYFSYLFIALLLLTKSEEFAFIDLFFEASSAIATVGLTVGITSKLSIIGKLIIIILMFIGRVGPSTVLFSFRNSQKNKAQLRYPHADILVG